MPPKEQYLSQKDLGRDVQQIVFFFFSPSLSLVSSLCILLPFCFTQSSVGTPYLPAKTVFSNTESTERISGSCETDSHTGMGNTVIKASLRRQGENGWKGMKCNIKTDEHDLIWYSPVFLHVSFFPTCYHFICLFVSFTLTKCPLACFSFFTCPLTEFQQATKYCRLSAKESTNRQEIIFPLKCWLLSLLLT